MPDSLVLLMCFEVLAQVAMALSQAQHDPYSDIMTAWLLISYRLL